MSGVIPRAQQVVCESVLPRYREFITSRIAKIAAKELFTGVYITVKFREGGFIIEEIPIGAETSLAIEEFMKYLESIIGDFVESQIKYHNCCENVKPKQFEKEIKEVFQKLILGDENKPAYLEIYVEPVKC